MVVLRARNTLHSTMPFCTKRTKRIMFVLSSYPYPIICFVKSNVNEFTQVPLKQFLKLNIRFFLFRKPSKQSVSDSVSILLILGSSLRSCILVVLVGTLEAQHDCQCDAPSATLRDKEGIEPIDKLKHSAPSD